MAITVLDLNSLFQTYWGMRPAGKVKVDDFDGSKNYITTGSKMDLDNPTLVNVKSPSGNYGDYYASDSQGRSVFMPLTLGGIFLPYCWVSVKGNKRIVETPMTERRGMVREFIAMDDYSFDVKGFVIGHNGAFPEQEIEALRNLFERNEAIECSHRLTDIFLLSQQQAGQDLVVMYDLDINTNQAIEHVRGYSFTIKSDQQFELELI